MDRPITWFSLWNVSQLAKMKKYIPGLPVPYKIRSRINWSEKLQLSFNPRPPGPFSVTRPPKGGGGCCNPSPGFSIYNKRSLPLCLLPLYSYESLLSIDTKISTVRLRMTPLWCHKISATSKFWTYIKCTQKVGKYRFSAKNRRNMQFSRNFREFLAK